MIKVLTAASELRAIASEWDELAAADSSATPYQTAALTLGLWSLLAPKVRPRVVVARDDDGKLTAILPLGIHRRRVGPMRLRILGPLARGHGSYFDAIVAPCSDSGVITAMLDAARQHADDWDAIALPHLRSESRLHAAAKTAGLRSGYEGARQHIPLSSVGAEPLGHAGKEIRRRWRRLREQFPDARYEIADDRASVQRWTHQLITLHDARWSATGIRPVLRAADSQGAVTNWLADLSVRGLAELHLLTAGPRFLAGLLVFHWGQRTYGWRVASDRSLHALGVGIQVFQRTLEYAGARGDTAHDLGRGDDAYKATWKTAKSELVRLRGGGPGHRWKMLVWLGRLTGRRWASRWLDGSVHAAHHAQDDAQ